MAGEGGSAHHNLMTKTNKKLEWSIISINDETKPSAAKEYMEQYIQTKHKLSINSFLSVKNNLILNY